MKLDEPYKLTYKHEVLEDMSDTRRVVFEGSLKRFVISTTQIMDTREIVFNMYQDHFLEAVARWPWLLCSDLGAHLEPSFYEDQGWTYGKPTTGRWSSGKPSFKP